MAENHPKDEDSLIAVISKQLEKLQWISHDPSSYMLGASTAENQNPHPKDKDSPRAVISKQLEWISHDPIIASTAENHHLKRLSSLLETIQRILEFENLQACMAKYEALLSAFITKKRIGLMAPQDRITTSMDRDEAYLSDVISKRLSLFKEIQAFEANELKTLVSMPHYPIKMSTSENHLPKDEADLSAVTSKRISHLEEIQAKQLEKLFEEILAKQLEKLQYIPHDPIKTSTSENHHPKDWGEADLSAVISKRISLFEEIQAKQLEKLQSLPHDLIKVTLPDGSVKEGKRWETTPMNIAAKISKGLANSALISSVNNVLWDMNRPLEGDCSLEIFRFDSDKGRDTFWHSSAHILGQALEQEYGCKLCIGPCTTRQEGFYYDAFYGDWALNEQHFATIEAGAAKAAQEGQPFERIEVTKYQAIEMFSDNNFKVEIINGLPADEIITVYRCGPLVDLCHGPHIPNTSLVKAFKCLKASSAYWRAKRDRESLQRVYGISYPDDKQLKAYLKSIEEAKKYDHRVLGQQQELFYCHQISPGSWFFLEHGTRVYKKLMTFIEREYWKRGYTEVISPNIYKMDLWETSGHAANYKENMFTFNVDKQEFGLKPMNCPGHCMMFQHRLRSYKDLPIRLADFGVLHRNEASGALSGLTRVRRFQQDDAHIFCKKDQVREEVKRVLDFVDYVYTKFGFVYELKLSTRPVKYLGDLDTWDEAEKALKQALKDSGKPLLVNDGDGAFYGPKIDITVSDAMKRKFQCATIQLDFQLPDRFELEYAAEGEGKRERPVMIHRAVLGSIERMFAILLEHYKGKWPFWLSPRQAIVCSLSKNYCFYAEQVRDQIHEAGYYVDVDTTDKNIRKEVRDAQVAQYNYILVVGAEETTTGQVTVRLRDEDRSDRSKFPVMSIGSLLDEFKLKTANFL